MARSGFGQVHLVWKQASVQESSGPVLAECNQHATSLPLSDSVAFFHRQPRSYCAKPSWIWLDSGWMSKFCQMNLVWKQAGVQESSGLPLANASKTIHIRCKWDLACLQGKVSLNGLLSMNRPFATELRPWPWLHASGRHIVCTINWMSGWSASIVYRIYNKDSRH